MEFGNQRGTLKISRKKFGCVAHEINPLPISAYPLSLIFFMHHLFKYSVQIPGDFEGTDTNPLRTFREY